MLDTINTHCCSRRGGTRYIAALLVPDYSDTVLLTRTSMCSRFRRADQLMADDNDDAIPYCIATGDIKKLVTFFSGRGQLLEALIIAQVERGRG